MSTKLKARDIRTARKEASRAKGKKDPVEIKATTIEHVHESGMRATKTDFEFQNVDLRATAEVNAAMGAIAGAREFKDRSFCPDQERDDTIKASGWGRLGADALKEIAKHSPIVEVFAGSGRNTAMLRTVGADVVAYDLKDTNDGHYWKDWEKMPCSMYVERGDAVAAAEKHPDRALLMIWPPGTDVTTRTLSAYKGSTVMYVGEARGANPLNEFFDELDAHWDVIAYVAVDQHVNIKDALWVLQRRVADATGDQKSGGQGQISRCIPNSAPEDGKISDPRVQFTLTESVNHAILGAYFQLSKAKDEKKRMEISRSLDLLVGIRERFTPKPTVP